MICVARESFEEAKSALAINVPIIPFQKEKVREHTVTVLNISKTIVSNTTMENTTLQTINVTDSRQK